MTDAKGATALGIHLIEGLPRPLRDPDVWLTAANELKCSANHREQIGEVLCAHELRLMVYFMKEMAKIAREVTK